MTKVWFPLQPLQKKKKKKEKWSRLPSITPAAHNESPSQGTHALPSKYPIYPQRIQAVQPHTSCLLSHCRRLSVHSLISPNDFFFFLVFPPLHLFQEASVINALSEFPMKPWIQDPGYLQQGSSNFSLPFHPPLLLLVWHKPIVSKIWGRTRKFRSVLRVSHDVLIGPFMEWGELRPHLTHLPLSHFPIARWGDVPHDLKNLGSSIIFLQL